jgi:hypothetical protein
VRYLKGVGEVVDNYEDGAVVNNNGSWLVGGPTLPSDPPTTANDNHPTVFMPANPEVGDVFKPENLIPVVDETAEVVRLGVKVKVPADSYEDTIAIEETSALEPGTTTKWYAPGRWRCAGKGQTVTAQFDFLNAGVALAADPVPLSASREFDRFGCFGYHTSIPGEGVVW